MKKIYVLLLLVSSWLYGVTLYPMSADIVSKRDRNILFTVSNPTKEPVAVEFSVKKLLDTSGKKEKRIDTTDVVWYPSQFVLGAGKSKHVRVRYVKSSLPKVEEVYRVIAKELDVDVSDKIERVPKDRIKATVKFRFTYEGLLFVSNGKVFPKLQISDFKKTHRGLEIYVTNNGTKSDVLNIRDYDIIVTVNGKDYLLTKQDVKKAEFRRILPGKTNKFLLRYVKLPNGKIDSVRIERK
ncbi:MAG: fimbria/pilus periplasmic chaperone [Epsilonproteobacteria bacterium]|nr:fimbria/pilus periplasmic chaperone [Campylobacterota bacterium]